MNEQGYWVPKSPDVVPAVPPARSLAPARDELIRALSATQGNVSRAAEAAGVKRSTFDGWLRKEGINPNDYRP